MMDVWVLVLVTFSVWESVGAESCLNQVCNCTGSIAYCDNRGLTRVPESVGSAGGYIELYLQNNNITTIPQADLPSGLVLLDLRYNPLSNISHLAFNKCANTLSHLWIGPTSSENIPAAIGNLNKLRDLRLQDMYVTRWGTSVLRHVGATLTSLTLAHTIVPAWAEWLELFPLLTQLTTDSSPLGLVPDDVFHKNTATLRKVTLKAAGLNSVPPALAALGGLEELDLSENQLRSSRDLAYELIPHLHTLSSLSLSGNLLQDIPRISFLTNLSRLNLSRNGIYDVTAGLTGAHNSNSNPAMTSAHDSNSNPAMTSAHNSNSNPAMTSAHDSNSNPAMTSSHDSNSNPAVTSSHDSNSNPAVTSAHVANIALPQGSLSVLDLSHNNFRETPKVILGLVRLRVLNLAHNLLTEVRGEQFPIGSGLEQLYLQGNPLTSLATDAFHRLQHLQLLDLSATKLTRLPLALAQLSAVEIVDVRGVSPLVCTCVERALRPWALSLPHLVLLGHCGEIPLTYFFRVLAAQCPPS
ncbi:adenylate cyclase [Aplysia californica]|uniref:Adenylate cyclase n=1 Tax=Aplysia californica TaxID=6500 RepID=A0ABM1VY71_APLCA|nr:adenylate cyclase [Aplysia californica]